MKINNSGARSRTDMIYMSAEVGSEQCTNTLGLYLITFSGVCTQEYICPTFLQEYFNLLVLTLGKYSSWRFKLELSELRHRVGRDCFAVPQICGHCLVHFRYR